MQLVEKLMPYFINLKFNLRHIRKLKEIILIGYLVLTVFACSSTNKQENKIIDDSNLNTISTLNRSEPDERGLITYETYQIFIAPGNETIIEIAEKLGIDSDELALYNGLIPNYRPRKKEVLALPYIIAGYKKNAVNNWTEEIAEEAIESAPNSPSGIISNPSNPLRHRVSSGETIYSIARLYKVSVSSLASWNGLGPDLNIKTGREIIIPAAAIFKDTSATGKKIVKDKLNEQKIKSKSSQVVVKSTEPQNTIEKESVPKSVKIISVKPFISPVNGKILNPYIQSEGLNNNNGIDYQISAGESVVSVAEGVVVLISDIVGGNGKIVLIKHANELITIYGRLKNVSVSKGQRVLQGEKIGEVSESKSGKETTMHFEVRRGMKSIDPTTLIR